MLTFQVHLYRFSLTNHQFFDTTNMKSPSTIPFTFPSPSNNEYLNNGFNRYICSDYILSDYNATENYSPYISNNIYNYAGKNERNLYHSNSNSPSSDKYSFPYNNLKSREVIHSPRQSYPKPFRTSSSAGALISSYKSSSVMSPSSDYSRTSVQHIIGKEQTNSRDVNNYKSMPTITTANNSNGMERRNKAQSLVVGKYYVFVDTIVTYLWMYILIAHISRSSPCFT